MRDVTYLLTAIRRGGAQAGAACVARLFPVISTLLFLLGFSWIAPTLWADEGVPSDQSSEEVFTFGQPTNLGPQEKKTDDAEEVLALCYTPDGQTLATAGQAKTVKLWDTATRKPVATFTGHTDAVTSVAFSPDGKLLATASYDQTIRLWDRAAGKELRVLKGHTNAVNCVAFAPDGLTVASGSFDKTVRLWETATGKELAQLKGHKASVRALAFSPQGKILASGGGDRNVYLWNLADKSEKARLSGHTGAVRALAFAPNAKTLASASEDRTVRIWEMDQSEPKEIAVLDANAGMDFVQPYSPVFTLAYSPQGGVLATGSIDGSVRLWNPVGRFVIAVLPGHARGVTCVAYSSSGRQIATAGRDKTVKLRNVVPPTIRALVAFHGDKESSFAMYSPDGRWLATGGKDAVRIHDPGAIRMGGALPGRFPKVKWAAFSPDGTSLALACQDKSVRLWDVATKTVKATLEGHKLPIVQLAFAPDGKTVASAAGLENSRGNTERGGLGELKLWDLTTGKERASLLGHNEGVFTVAFAPDGKTLASGSGDGTVKLWDPATATERLTLSDHEGDVRVVAFSPDGKTLASGCDDGTIRLWDPYSGKQIRLIDVVDSTINALAFSRDGKLLAASVVPFEGKGVVRLWEVDTGILRSELMCEKAVSALAFAPDGTLVLGVTSVSSPSNVAIPSRIPTRSEKGQGGEVQIWDVNSKSLLATLHPLGPVSTLAFAPDGRTLMGAGGGADGSEGEVRFWLVSHARDGYLLRGHAGQVGCGAYSPDGKTLATGGQDKSIRLWDVDNGQERATLRGFANPPLRARFSPDGKTLAVACESEKVATLWTLAGRTTLAGHTLPVSDLAFAPEGRRLATSAGTDKAGEVKLWDLDTGREIATLPKQANAVRSVAFASDGRTLAVACGKNVTLWDPATSTELKRWELANPVCQVAFAPDGATLAVGLESGTVMLHRALTGQALATLEGPAGALCSLAFSPDGKMLVAAVKGGQPTVWELPNSLTP